MADSIARLIDHALLHPTLTDEQLREGCELAMSLHVATVCIKPYWIARAARLLKGSDVGVSTVIGFPHGSTLTEVKSEEARRAIDLGACELDMVANVGKVLSRDWSYVAADIAAVVEVAHQQGKLLKVIFENEYLPDDEFKIELCRNCCEVGADFVKTSTGFGFISSPAGGFRTVGATDHDLQLMRAHCNPRVGVKASGGVRTYGDALRVVELGATRIGTSSSAAIVEGERAGQPATSARDGY